MGFSEGRLFYVLNSPRLSSEHQKRAVSAVEMRADHRITGYTFFMNSQSQPLSEIESPRSIFAKSCLVSGRLASPVLCKAVHVFLTRLITDLCKSYRILLISSIALLTTHSLNVIGAKRTPQADARQPVIDREPRSSMAKPTIPSPTARGRSSTAPAKDGSMRFS